jgi:hypothetical protein
MSENLQSSRGRPSNYKFDRGGMPTEFGPFIGTVMNNVDSTRSGRLQVYIEQFAGPNKEDSNLWRTVSYCPPFYGSTPRSGTATGAGTFTPGNPQSYGMWFTPPDIGVQVLCVFVAGDPNQGYYIGCVPDQGITHMIPAIGAASNYQNQNKTQKTYFTNAPRMPVTEINNAPTNNKITENPKFFDQPKPVHSYVAAVMFQQGLANDTIRGPIASSAQRESPSSCYGISTPGRPIYQGGLNEETIKKKLKSGAVKPQDATVIGRRGGHTFVMDDGDLEGADNLIRIRTAKGHQITMSDDGNCFYICHSNGQTWIELGQEGTVDVFSTNSVNVRTEGTINLHADKDINMYAGGKINMKSTNDTNIQSDAAIGIATKKDITLFGMGKIGVKANGTLSLIGVGGGYLGGGPSLSLSGGTIDLNGGPKIPVQPPKGLTTYTMPNTEFNNSVGWKVSANGLTSIVTRAPTHEPWPYHNQGVKATVSLESGQPGLPPDAPAVPSGWAVTKTS